MDSAVNFLPFLSGRRDIFEHVKPRLDALVAAV